MTTSLSTPPEPCASLFVMGYNQASTIREAVEGAFAQTAGPLEIVLSDDGSTDQTFEIMQQMAEAYDGPHQVRLNRNETNLGFVGHLNKAFDLCSHDLIIYNPGDDISLPERAEVLLEVFKADNPLLIHSDLIEIESGNTYSRQDHLESLDLVATSKSLSLCVGATCAWHKDIMRLFGPIEGETTFDDLIFYFRAAIADRVSHVPQPLIHYRTDGGLSTHRAPTVAGRIAQEHKTALRKVDTYRQRLKDCRHFAPHLTDVIAELEKNLAISEYKLSMHDDWRAALRECVASPGKFKLFLSALKRILKAVRK